MKSASVIMICVSMVGTRAEAVCEGRIPYYVMLGEKGMTWTDDAVRVLCRDDAALERWKGGAVRGSLLIEDRIVSQANVATILRDASSTEFRHVVFEDAVFIRGTVPGRVVFRECEFRGNVDIQDAELQGDIVVVSSVFHQRVQIQNSVFRRALLVEGSILSSSFEIGSSEFANGVRLKGTRVVDQFVTNGLKSGASIEVESSRFLSSVRFAAPDIAGSVRFHESEWSSGRVIELSRGFIGGALRFDLCGFQETWSEAPASGEVQIRLADMAVGSAVSVATTTMSKAYPQVRIARCVIPFLKLPEWTIGRQMVMGEEGRVDLEELGEELQMLYKSYESSGRLRDAYDVRAEHRVVVAKLRGGPALWIRWSAQYFGTGLWWFSGTIVAFATTFLVKGKRWGVFDTRDGVLLKIYRCIDVSMKGFVGGPPDSTSLDKAAVAVLRVERAVGIVFFFLLGIVVNDWLGG